VSDNLNYYYIKLKESYFDQDNIKILESLPNGHIYSLIILKLYLKSAKSEGRLMMTPSIPYDPEKVEILANVLGHDISHVKEALRLGLELDLITIIKGYEIWMTDIQNFIGKSSTEADRKRKYRNHITSDGQMSGQISDKSPPEIEKEIEIEKEAPAMKRAYELSCLIKTLHKQFDKKYSGDPNLWTQDIEKLLRIDHRGYDEIKQVIHWCKTPENFWFSNIMSGKNLRKQYPKLLAQMKNDQKKGPELIEIQLDQEPLEFGSLL